MYTEYVCLDMKPKRSEVQVSLSFRLYGDEALRWKEVFKRARARDVEATKTDVLRALADMADAPPNLVTPEDRAYFQGYQGVARELDVKGSRKR